MSAHTKTGSSKITREAYGETAQGDLVERFTLKNQSGSVLRVITYGGIITELHVPDRSGALQDVVLGCKDLDAYLAGHPWFGAITGRVAGRISGGGFELDGQTYQLEVNHPPNHLHGGSDALDKRIWSAEPSLNDQGEPTLCLSYVSPHGESGYPGEVSISVTYTLDQQNRLVIDYDATADRSTPLSLTNHTYFNLGGQESQSVADHTLQLSCPYWVPTDDNLTLSGRVESVEGHPNDLRVARRLGEVAPKLWKQHGDHYLTHAHVRDHIEGDADPKATELGAPTWIARLIEPTGGIQLDVYSDTSGVQLYTGASLDHPAHLTKSGRPYSSLGGLCLECQGYPDGVNQPEIEEIMIGPHRPYRQRTIYALSVASHVDDSVEASRHE